MNNAAALHELNRALAQFRRRQASAPTPHSAREIAQVCMLAEYLYASHEFNQTHDQQSDGFHQQAA